MPTKKPNASPWALGKGNSARALPDGLGPMAASMPHPLTTSNKIIIEIYLSFGVVLFWVGPMTSAKLVLYKLECCDYIQTLGLGKL